MPWLYFQIQQAPTYLSRSIKIPRSTRLLPQMGFSQQPTARIPSLLHMRWPRALFLQPHLRYSLVGMLVVLPHLTGMAGLGDLVA